jgi:hypothetical protein
LRTSEPFKVVVSMLKCPFAADRHAIETDVRRAVGFVLQQVEREVRAFADHAFADAVDEGRWRQSSCRDVFNDHLHLRAFVQHEEVARLDQLTAIGGDVQHVDRLARLRAFGGEDDEAVGGCRGVHRGEETIADGRDLSVVGLHRAVRQVMLQAVDDDALVGFQVIAEVRAEVAVDEDDAGGIEGQARGSVTVASPFGAERTAG